MATIPIHTSTDITTARNMLRKKISAYQWTPTLRARAVAALTIIGELILASEVSSGLEIINLHNLKEVGIEVRGQLDHAALSQAEVDEIHLQLTRAVDELEIYSADGRLHITARLWLNNTSNTKPL